MAFIDKLKVELDRAGRVAQDALDEGKTRIEGFRARQLADKAAEALGYAVYRARQAGGDIDADSYSRLAASLTTHDAEASRYEAEINTKRTRRADSSASGPAPTAAASETPASKSEPEPPKSADITDNPNL